MRNLILVLLVFVLLGLSACGFNRDSNGPPTPETQLDSKSKNVPNTGNEEVDLENDVGTPDKNEDNDHIFDK